MWVKFCLLFDLRVSSEGVSSAPTVTVLPLLHTYLYLYIYLHLFISFTTYPPQASLVGLFIYSFVSLYVLHLLHFCPQQSTSGSRCRSLVCSSSASKELYLGSMYGAAWHGMHVVRGVAMLSYAVLCCQPTSLPSLHKNYIHTVHSLPAPPRMTNEELSVVYF